MFNFQYVPLPWQLVCHPCDISDAEKSRLKAHTQRQQHRWPAACEPLTACTHILAAVSPTTHAQRTAHSPKAHVAALGNKLFTHMIALHCNRGRFYPL